MLAQMESLLKQQEAEKGGKSTLKTLSLGVLDRAKLESVKQIGALLDGGASHDVFYSATVSEGSEARDVDLAHGTKRGYVKNDDNTFIDEAVTEGQDEIPSIISLGRLINYGARMEWTASGALLTLPSGKQ